MHYAFEHRTYQPMIFIFILMALLLQNLNLFQKRYINYAFVFILLSYISLNQIRNSQIKDSVIWKLHTLKNSITIHSFNFKYTVELLASGNVDDLQEVMDKYEKNYPLVPTYIILNDFYAFFKNNQSEVYLNKISNDLLTMNIPANQRIYIDSFLVAVLSKKILI